MKPKSECDRRDYLKGLCGAVALAGGVPIAAGSGVNDVTARTATGGGGSGDREHPDARPILCDVSSMMEFETIMHYDGDPAEDDRERVAHVTSEGAETRDYAAGLVNVRRRTGKTVTLDDIDGGELSYDYFQGPDHTTAAPDEVFLVLQTAGQKDDEGVALFKTINDGKNAPSDLDDGDWKTVDVADEMGSGDWRSIGIDEDPEDMRISDDETIGEAVERTAASLRDQEETFDDVFDEYDHDTELVGVGFGVGNTRESVEVDVYYDDLVVNVPSWDRDEYTFDFPAVVPMDLSFEPNPVDSGDVTIAQLELTQDEEGVDLDDLIEDSVALFAYSEAAPPLEEEFVEADSVSVDGGVDVTFDADDIADLDLLGDNGGHVLVAGEFDYDQVVWFLSQEAVEIEVEN